MDKSISINPSYYERSYKMLKKNLILPFKLLVFILILNLCGCTNSGYQQTGTISSGSTNVNTQTPPPMSPTEAPPQNIVLPKTVKAKCTSNNPANDLKPFYYKFTIGTNKYIIDEYGKVTLTKPDGQKISVHLWKGDWGILTRLYYIKFGDDLVLIYEHGGEGYTDDICRLNAGSLSIKYTTDFFGYLVCNGYLENNFMYVYVSSPGFIMKFNLQSGSTLWQSPNLAIDTISFTELKTDLLELRGKDTNNANMISELDKSSGKVLRESQCTEPSASVLKLPLLETTIPIIGQKYSKIKSNVDKWVYGRKSQLIDITNNYSSIRDDTKKIIRLYPSGY